MSVTIINPKHTSTRNASEHARIAARYEGSARELFPPLRALLLASRPVIGERVTFPHKGRNRLKPKREPIYGTPTFRNRINENGEHV